MQQGFNNSIYIDNDQFVGICLGSDYCTEHEIGINPLLEEFGVGKPNSSIKEKIFEFFSKEKSKFGIETRKITQCPKNLFWIESNSLFRKSKKIWFGIYYSEYAISPPENIHAYVKDDDTLITLWDDKGFCILSCDQNYRNYLLELYDAFKQNDILFTLQSLFLSVGFTICIASKIPEKEKLELYNVDLEQDKLKKAFEDSGIESKLRNARKGFFALRPKSFGENGQLMILLNPYEQNKYNMGLYSIQDLEQWIENKGPIVK